MFDLNRAFAGWRHEMVVSGVESVETLDELESHLRDIVEQLFQAGVEQEKAFKFAVDQLGTSVDLAVEFQKIKSNVWLPTRLATVLILLELMALILLLSGRVRNGGMDLLLASHVFAITIGYTSAMVVGGLGICYVCERWARGFPIGRARSLSRSTFLFTGFSALLTMVGVTLGAVWANEHLGRYWGWDIKEIGGLAVCSWLILELALQQHEVSTRAAMILGIGGNIIVGLAWFGANLVTNGLKSDGAMGYLLIVFVAVNVMFCLLGFLPARTLRQKAH